MLEVSVEPICIGWQAYTANQPRRLAANRKNWLILVGEVLRYFRVDKKISPACSAGGRSASASVHGAQANAAFHFAALALKVLPTQSLHPRNYRSEWQVDIILSKLLERRFG
jgi:hypothetical protein